MPLTSIRSSYKELLAIPDRLLSLEEEQKNNNRRLEVLENEIKTSAVKEDAPRTTDEVPEHLSQDGYEPSRKNELRIQTALVVCTLFTALILIYHSIILNEQVEVAKDNSARQENDRDRVRRFEWLSLIYVEECNQYGLCKPKAPKRIRQEAVVRLARLDREKLNLAEANLRELDLRKANFREVDFYRADLSEANLSGTDLSEANLIGANLFNASLTSATLNRTRLYGADLRFEADSLPLTESSIELRNRFPPGIFDQACGDEATRLPSGRNPPEHWLDRPIKSNESDEAGCP